MRYRAFRRKKDGLFYFQFLSEDSQVLLNSQSYRDKDNCFNGIRSVLNNAGKEGNYEKSVDGNGNHFFILKAANGQEIGRSRRYDNLEDVEKAVANFILEGPGSSSRLPETTTTADALETASKGAESHQEDQYDLNQLSNSGETGFEAFQNQENGSYYFHYNDAEGNALLFSQAYTSTSGRNNGIKSVRKNAANEKRFQLKEDEQGHYFVIKAGNNQEIARSRYFRNQDSMTMAVNWFVGSVTTVSGEESESATPTEKQTVAATPAPKKTASDTTRIYKDYKPLAFYQERISGLDFGYDTFDADDNYYFAVNYEGSPLLLSEDYNSDAGRDNGVKSVKKNSKIEKRYERMVHPNGMHYFNLLAGNKQEIATSRWFESEKDMEKAINWLMSTGGTRRRKKQKKAKPSQERTYLSQGQAYLCNNITYDTFQSGGNQRYYFVFKNKDGKAVLINGNVRGFETKKDLKKGIQAILEFAPQPDKYERKTTKNGKHYFYLKDDKGKSIARGSLFYAEETDMDAAINLVQCGGAKLTAASVTPSTGSSKKSTIDEYLACEAYAGSEGFHTFQHEDNGEYYFAYNDSKGTTYLRSEGYIKAKSRDNGIQSVIKNAPIEKRWGSLSEDGSFYYFLRAGNNQEIGRSCPYSDEAAMLAALNWIQGDESSIGFSSALVGGVLMSAAMLGKGEGKSQDTIKEEEAALAAANLKAEDEARIAAEVEADKLRAKEAAKLAEEAEATRIKIEEEEAALAAAALAATNLKEEEEAKVIADAEAARIKAEEEAKLVEEAETGKIKTEEEEAALAAATLAAANLKAAEQAKLVADAKAAEKQEKAAAAALAASQAGSAKGVYTEGASKKRSGGWPRWLLPLIIGLLLIMAMLYFMKGCEGCFGAGAKDDDSSIGITDDTGDDGISRDSTSINGNGNNGNGNSGIGDGTSGDGKSRIPDNFGKDGKALGFGAGSMEAMMADYLSAGNSTFPKQFWADNIKFNKNNDRLRTAARKQLDNLAVLLKEYPYATIDIYGYINDKEDITFKGNKEVTLDDARARAAYNYLISRGIDASRMDFLGNGLNDEGGIEVNLKSR